MSSQKGGCVIITHRKLSPYKQQRNNQRKRIFNYILERAYIDRERNEIVSTVNKYDVLTACHVTFVSLVPNIEKGEVLIDSRGHGSFQRGITPVDIESIIDFEETLREHSSNDWDGSTDNQTKTLEEHVSKRGWLF